jgi:hypothetical protein
MMKIVWSLICIQYFGSINKVNLNIAPFLLARTVSLNAVTGITYLSRIPKEAEKEKNPFEVKIHCFHRRIVF